MYDHRSALLSAIRVVVMTFCFAVTASAQVARVFLSGTGNDLNDCSDITTPCRSLQGAINQCPVNGEIIVLTSGGFGTANITKSLTINVPDGVVAFNAREIDVAIGPTDTVVIRGISMNGSVFGDNFGMKFTSGGKLIVENSIVDGFAVANVYQDAPGGSLIVNNCEIRNSPNIGLRSGSSTSSATNYLTVQDSRFLNNYDGVDVSATTIAVIKSSVISGNQFGIFVVGSTNGDPKVTIDSCVIAHNAAGTSHAAGILAQDNGVQPYDVTVRVTNSSIYANHIGVEVNQASIVSYGTNQLYHNETDGAFSSTIAQQ